MSRIKSCQGRACTIGRRCCSNVVVVDVYDPQVMKQLVYFSLLFSFYLFSLEVNQSVQRRCVSLSPFSLTL